jgi:thiamine pyrophosphokinase
MDNPQLYSQTDAIVVCNGDIGMTKEEFRDLLHDKPYVVCADGGANRLRRWKIRPHLIIGDLDSLIPLTKRVFSDIDTIHLPDQNSTDLEKVLDHLIARTYKRALVLGATGNQIDHTLANISILLKYRGRIDLLFKDKEFDLFFIAGTITVMTEPGQRVSLMPIGVCSGITTEGLLYSLVNESMAFGVREGVSNAATGEKVTVTVKEGSMLMMVKR